MAKFTKEQLNTLRDEFSKMRKIDPASPAYEKMKAYVRGLSRGMQEQLKNESIPFLSPYANLCLIKKMNGEMEKAEDTLAEIASSMIADTILTTPATVIFANTVEKVRNGEEYALNDLSHVVERLAHSGLPSEDIAIRLTNAFRDVFVKS